MIYVIMATEDLNIQENSHQKAVIGDGACLFRSISHLIFGTEAMFLDVRQAIILHIIKNWKYFSQMIYESQGHKCKSVAEYFAEMSKPFMQGGVPEIQAAVQVYNLVFEVYSGDKLYFKVGQEGRPVVTLRYAEPLDNDNSNAYIMHNQLPTLQKISPENLQTCNKIPDTVDCNIIVNQDSSNSLDQKLLINDHTWTGITQTDLRANDRQGISTSNKYCFIQQKPRKRYKPMTTRVHRKRFRQRLLIKEKILAYETTLQKEQEILRLHCHNEIEQNSNTYGPSAVNIKQEAEDISIDTIEIEEPNLIQIKQEPEFINSDVD